MNKAVSIVGAADESGAPTVQVGTGSGAAITVSAEVEGGTVGLQNLVTDGGSNGIRVASTAELKELAISNVSISNASGSGFELNDAEGVAAVSIEGSEFVRNALGGSNGTGDIVIFQYHGDVTLSEVTVTGAEQGTTPRADNAIQISGFEQSSYDVLEPIGSVTIDGVHVTGDYDKPHLAIQGYTDLSGLTIGESSLSGASGWGVLAFIDPIADGTTDAVSATPGRPGAYDGSGAATSTLDLSGLTVVNSDLTAELDVFVRGLAAADIQTGTEGRDALNIFSENDEDLGGNDVLSGLGGDDTLFGGDGDDTLDGGEGTDEMTGGAGNDVYVAEAGDTVIEAEDEGVDTVLTKDTYTLGENVENLVLMDAAENAEDFEDFDLGAITDGENDWAVNSTANSDQAVVTDPEDGDNQVFKISSDPSSGAFAGPYTPGLDVAAGESSTSAGADSMQIGFTFRAVDPDPSDNATLEVDFGTEGATDRNNFMRIENTGDGLRIAVSDPLADGNWQTGDTLNDFSAFTGNTTLIEGVDPTVEHRLIMVMRFNDGADNDVVDFYLDDLYIGSSTSFENYRDFYGSGDHDANAEANQVSRLFFRTSAAGAETDGAGGLNEGFYFDDISYSTFDAAGPSGTGNTLDNTITGNSGANLLSGLGGDDSLSGGLGNDTLEGGEGDDVLDGGLGNDSLVGGAGTDVALMSGARSDYDITRNPDGSYSVTRIADQSIDHLTGVEGVLFEDGITYELDANSPDFTGAFLRFSADFETDASAFVANGSTVALEASGSNGVDSADGGSHLRISESDSGGAFTRFDGYRTSDDEGVVTKIAIYLDTGMAAGEGFDYSVAANSQGTNAHLRDFIFHVTQDATTGELLVGASNNSNYDPINNLETGNHAVIDASGWYTFEHKFYENADGELEVAMNVYDASGAWVFTEVRAAGDDWDSFGGNRYGWFTNVDVTGGIAVDSLTLATLDQGPVQLVQGNVILGQFDTIQEAIDAAGAGDTIRVAAGNYAEQLVIDKAITIEGAEGAVLSPTSGAAITLSGDLGGGDVAIGGLDIVDGGSATYGVFVTDGANVGELSLTDLSISGFAGYGIRSSDGGTPEVPTLDALTVTDVEMSNNGTGGSNGASHIKLFGFDGDATFTNLTIDGEDEATPQSQRPDNAIEITGAINSDGNANPAPAHPPASGNIVFANVVITGSYHKNPLAIFHFADILGLDIQSLDLSDAQSNWGPLLNIDGITSETIDASGFVIVFPEGTPEGMLLTELQAEKTGQGVVVDTAIIGTSAADSLHGKSGNDSLYGGDGDDALYGGNKPGNEFDDGEGDDALYGGAGNDSAYGGEGDDTLDGGEGDDVLEGGNGADELFGGADNDTLIGGGSADLLDGGFGDDLINAGGGRDIIFFSAGQDTVNGGAGQDTLVLLGTAADYSIDLLGSGSYRITRASDGAVTLAESIENLSFQPADPIDAVDDAFTVDAGGVRTLDVLANDGGAGMVLAATVQAPGLGIASASGDGGAVEYDLTSAYQYLDEGQSEEVEILYLLSDGGSSSDVALATVTVEGVADDVGAISDSDTAANEVAEGLSAGAEVGLTALAVDPDQGSTVTYSLVDNADGAFVIDSATGVVTTAQELDREGAGGATREITVLATSSDGSTSEQSFTIAVTDANDNGVSVPVDDDGAPNSVAEGAANGTLVGITALAADPDVADSVSYSLTDDAGGAFQIDNATGVVSVLNGTLIDREADATLEITVLATSSDGSTETETFVIAIQDVDEADVTAPVDVVGAPGGSVLENASVGTAVGITVSASDADATQNGITYSLVDDDGGRFLISSTTGEVLVAGAIDREEGPSRSITVRATSQDGSFADTTFEIAVQDVNEFSVSAPVDVDTAENAVGAAPSVGDYTGITVTAGDADATTNAVSYSLLTGASEFDIDATTGAITVGAGFDASGPVTRSVTVQALSADGSTATSTFDISVGDVFNIIDGTEDRDNLGGTAGRDVINGFVEADRLYGEEGDDVLNGGAGKDLLDGGEGDDQMAGGLDNDDYYVDSSGDVVIEAAGEGDRDTVFSTVSITALWDNVEYAELLGSDDLTAMGNDLDNRIEGNDGNNWLEGGLGRDKLYGEDGNDTLVGGEDVDLLFGGDGDDLLIGNAGRNVLTGGSGADTFQFITTPADASTYDRIKDFSSVDGDKLSFSSSAFSGLSGPVLAGQLVMGTGALDADDRLIFDGQSNKLYYDADGVGGADQQLIARIDDVTSLTVDDFVIV
ncbi:cadherin domain-containing protein [Alloyangia pacifica]|uniref:cadherin domain-containing protein n=1 Tax=Alloyangia pacifica TaxID=311180 RepID=UPI000B899419